jgi:CRISPR-associated protein (TIGR03985 family)
MTTSPSLLSLQALKTIKPLEKRTFPQTLRQYTHLIVFNRLEVGSKFTTAQYVVDALYPMVRGDRNDGGNNPVTRNEATKLLKDLGTKTFEQVLCKLENIELEKIAKTIGSNDIISSELVSITLAMPFQCDLKTIENDLDSLCIKGWLTKAKTQDGSQYTVNKLFDGCDDTEKAEYLPDSLNSFAHRLGTNRRFHIYSDYDTHDQLLLRKIRQNQDTLEEVWKNGKGSPCELVYRSASKSMEYSGIVYPVCIYYYQRTCYLFSFGRRKDSPNDQSNWYAYRFDRIQKLTPLTWNGKIIPQDLIEKFQDADDLDSIDEIEDSMRSAYGIDIERESKLMLLRFDKEYHDRYIADTWRHDTFKQVARQEVKNILQQSGKSQSQIDSTIDNHPKDAVYYKMNYRDGDNSVIMRLRAWCPVAEVVYPPDLRHRMRVDMENAWNLYSNDEETE